MAFFDATKPDTKLQWHDRPPGYLSDALIDSNGNMWAIIKSKLWKMTDGHWHQALSTEASGVCSQNNRVVVVGKKVWQESLDGGKSWRDMTPKSPSISYPSCAIKETLWVFGDSGKFSSSTLWIKAKQNWIKRPLPVRDLRKFKVDSKIPGAAVLGAWGEGVWKTKDFGVTWEDLGLQGVEVRSIAFLPGIKNLSPWHLPIHLQNQVSTYFPSSLLWVKYRATLSHTHHNVRYDLPSGLSRNRVDIDQARRHLLPCM